MITYYVLFLTLKWFVYLSKAHCLSSLKFLSLCSCLDALLLISQAFQEEMATHQPNMDALNKIAKKRKAETPTTNHEITKRITSLYKR